MIAQSLTKVPSYVLLAYSGSVVTGVFLSVSTVSDFLSPICIACWMPVGVESWDTTVRVARC
ncbi:uncharacterized protein BT62DRAFT_925397 [Guyanagaster necrorhizus]|uniref:Uncharacterized protein n=1 Tax=Guyanagaster necrorhizus TaxID=856835 RepID=A0A9P7W655_9AGAR|nr:uncharacterized protein BT62DRAFT_925397 [Guyanagaster necrorhizus MCA 3950]KAG7452858.1 hypothetical protein BT62DRAFT_925397 [Guyanagaster necrorhizus MCA 3950]